VAGAAEASVVLDDGDVLGFLDVSPATSGHLLVVPKRHVTDLASLDPATGAAMFEAGRRLVAAVRAALGSPGVNLFLADGEAAGQEVFHVHLHVLPRYAGDGFGVQAEFSSPSRAELDETASVVRRALG
jgi:diadenosine tetraphosphate (Ap4A) HIT family hydrolase